MEIVNESFLEQYFLTEHEATLKKLELCGIADCVPYKTHAWYTGTDEEGTIRKYYSAFCRGIKCFVKLATNDSTIKNEIFANVYMAECGISFIPRLLYYDYDYEADTSLLVTEFMEELHEFYIPREQKQFERLCSDFLSYLHCFRKYGIVHSDISAGNMMFNKEGKLIFTDFGIGKVPGSERFQIDYKAHDGNYYINEGKTRKYDDVYSFLCTLDECGIPEAYKQLSCYKEIEKELFAGAYTVAVQ